MEHLRVINKIKSDLEKDDNVLVLLLFGSVATKIYNSESDIDLMLIQQEFPSGYKFENEFVDGMKTGMSRWSLEKWIDTLNKQPYRKYILTYAQILFDKTGKAHDWQETIRNYFTNNPDVQEEWSKINVNYEEEKKKYGQGRTNIFDVYEYLDRKFDGRVLRDEVSSVSRTDVPY